MWNLYVLYNNKLIDIMPKSNNVGWSSNKDTLGVQLNFDSLYSLEEGAHIVLKKDSKIIFLGVVVIKGKGKFSNSYTCFDYAFNLNENETIIQFNKIGASDALKQLCTKFGIKANIVKMNTLINKIYKDETVSSIIADILDQVEQELGIKVIKEMISDTLYIRKLTDLKITPKILIGKDITVNSSIENMKNKVIVVSNEDAVNRIIASVQDSASISKYGQLQEVISVDKKDESKANNIAKNFLKQNNKVFSETTIPLVVSKDGEEIKANRMINISLKAMGIDGWYRIKSASHMLSKNNHKVSISIEW